MAPSNVRKLLSEYIFFVIYNMILIYIMCVSPYRNTIDEIWENKSVI